MSVKTCPPPPMRVGGQEFPLVGSPLVIVIPEGSKYNTMRLFSQWVVTALEFIHPPPPTPVSGVGGGVFLDFIFSQNPSNLTS